MRAIALACLAFAAADAAAVDTILHNGKVWTGDPGRPAATAIAIDAGRIVATGTDAAILELASKDTQRIDLKGHRVVPGINDAHTHITLGLPSVDIELPRDAGSAQVREAIAALPKTGDGWITADIGMEVLHDPAMRRAQLDALQPTRPLLLTGWTGHGMLVNSAAQKALGLSLEDVPAGGWLGRDASGAFDGRVYEYAQWSPRAGLPARPERLRRVIARDSDALLRLGVTSVQNMAIGTPLPDFIAAWKDTGTPLRLRAIRTPLARAPGQPPDHLDLPARDPARPSILVSGTKWILDGTPMERGAAMRAAYPDGGHGQLNFDQAGIEALLRETFARDDQPLLHVSGDATLAAVLDAMRATAPAAAWRALRPRIEHGEGLAPDLMARAGEFGIVLVQNPSHFMLPPPEAAYIDSHDLQPLADVLTAGIPLALGSDGPPSPWLNMMFAIAPASRPDQALTREQALRAYTAGSAFAEFSETEKGKIAPGHLADLAVLSQDVLDDAVPAQALPGTSSLLTLVDGKIAWRDPAF
ncbi:amidohydrolase family protein [Pseudoxanthomonas daejeonensis]|uniref:amidohydrolase n=1 Tax=Pseudoxanthomonas daejeonensis TaxID=266062 RepID=UPI001F542537|nr:amidohydrolase family protein [Pseudoxanthomonas daejeonensis]UNK56480.1 amidohydrolase family protein [Pseudoxanthomonas daejeonensis]